MSIPASVAILGAGPRGVGVIERIAANLGGASDPLLIHLVDPHPPGAGRIWRYDQSPLLKLNSMAEDVTMFTDESSTIDGPIVPGPSLIEWAQLVRSGELPDVAVDDDLAAAELRGLEPRSFPTRRLHSYYLRWFYRRALAALPASVTVVEHESTAVAVFDEGSQRVALANGESLDVDVVVYALGHIGAHPAPEHQSLLDFARRTGTLYVPPSFTADADLSAIEPGADVLVRGMGLAAVDLVVLLTEGRGGRFHTDAAGALAYVPSGLEPTLHLGSRRGVPYHSKITSNLVAPRVAPKYFTAAIATALERSSERLGFIDDVFPLIAKELLHGYYHELFVGHPDRVSTSWERFAAELEGESWSSDRLRDLVTATVIDPSDRLDLEQLDRPLAGESFSSVEHLQEHLRGYIADDLVARSAPEHSATLALFYSLLYALFDLGGIIDSPKWTARARAHELPRWWLNYFSFIASGPPGHRLEELLALSRAGIVRFLGAGLQVRADSASSRFVATSASVDAPVAAGVLIDARLPETDVATTDNPALRQLVDSSIGSEERVSDGTFTGTTGRIRVDASARVLGPDGAAHPRRFAIGAYTSAPFVGAFSRPRTNAVSFRENDRVARAVLGLTAPLESEPGTKPEPAVRR
ncbi:FAD/NAD(P)-binding protein [soil metagenome]